MEGKGRLKESGVIYLRKILIFSFTMIVLFAFLFGCSTDKSIEVRIGTQAIPNTDAIVKSSGWLEAGLPNTNIKWLSFDSGRDVNTAFASNSIDIGLLGSTLIANGLAKGIDYQVIWIADVIGENEALVVKKDSGIDSIEQIIGKKIAVTFGSTTQYSLLGALKTYGVDQEKVTIIDLQPQDMLAAWKRGDIDGGFIWQPTLEEMLVDGGQILLDGSDLVEENIITADIIVARTEFIEEYPEIVEKYVAAQIKAYELYKKNPNKAAELVAKEFLITKEQAQSMMDQLIWLSGEEQISDIYLGTTIHRGGLAKVLEDTALFLKNQKFLNDIPLSEQFGKAMNPSFIETSINKNGS